MLHSRRVFPLAAAPFRTYGIHYKQKRQDHLKDKLNAPSVEAQEYNTFWDRKSSDWLFPIPYGYQPRKEIQLEPQVGSWSPEMFEFFVDHYEWLHALHNFNFIRSHRSMKLFLVEWMRAAHTRTGIATAFAGKTLKDLDGMNRNLAIRDFMLLLKSRNNADFSPFLENIEKIVEKEYLTEISQGGDLKRLSHLTAEEKEEMSKVVFSRLNAIEKEIENDLKFYVTRITRKGDGALVSEAVAKTCKYYEFDLFEKDLEIKKMQAEFKKNRPVKLRAVDMEDYKKAIQDEVEKYLDVKSDEQILENLNAPDIEVPAIKIHAIPDESVLDFTVSVEDRINLEKRKRYWASWRGIPDSDLTEIQKIMKRIRRFWDEGERIEISRIIFREKKYMADPKAARKMNELIPQIYEQHMTRLLDLYAEEVSYALANHKWAEQGINECEDFKADFDWFMNEIVNIREPVHFLGFLGIPKIPLEMIDPQLLDNLRDLGMDTPEGMKELFDMPKLLKMLKEDLDLYLPKELVHNAGLRATENAFQNVYNRFSDLLRDELRLNGVQPKDLDSSVKKGLKLVIEKLKNDLLDEASQDAATASALGKHFIKLAQNEIREIRGTKPRTRSFGEDLLEQFMKTKDGKVKTEQVMERIRKRDEELAKLANQDIIDLMKIRLDFFEYASQKHMQSQIQDFMDNVTALPTHEEKPWHFDEKVLNDPNTLSEEVAKQNIKLLRWFEFNMRHNLYSMRKLGPFIYDLYCEADGHEMLRSIYAKSALHKLFLKHDMRLSPICRASYWSGPHSVFAMYHHRADLDGFTRELYELGNVDYPTLEKYRDVYEKIVFATEKGFNFISNKQARVFGDHVYVDRYLIKKNRRRVFEARKRKQERIMSTPGFKKADALMQERMAKMKGWLEQVGSFGNFTDEMKAEIEVWANEAAQSVGRQENRAIMNQYPLDTFNDAVELAFRLNGPFTEDETGFYIRDKFLDYAREIYNQACPSREEMDMMMSRVHHFMFPGVSEDGYVESESHYEKYEENPIDHPDVPGKFHHTEALEEYVRDVDEVSIDKKKYDLMRIPSFRSKLDRALSRDSARAQFLKDQFKLLKNGIVDRFKPSYESLDLIRKYGDVEFNLGKKMFYRAGFDPVIVNPLKAPVNDECLISKSGIENAFKRQDIEHFVNYYVKNRRLDPTSPLYGNVTLDQVRAEAKSMMLRDIRVYNEEVDVAEAELGGDSEVAPRMDNVFIDMTTGRHSQNEFTENHILLYDDADFEGKYSKNMFEYDKESLTVFDVGEDWEWGPMLRQAWAIDKEYANDEDVRKYLREKLKASSREYIHEVWSNEDRDRSFMVPDLTKEAIWHDHNKDPVKNDQWALAKKYNLRADRIDAILRLKHTEKVEFAEWEPFDIIMTEDGSLYGFDYQKFMENMYLPTKPSTDKIGVDFEGRPSTYTSWKPMYVMRQEEIPESGPGSGEVIETREEAKEKGHIANRHNIMITDLDEYKTQGIVKVAVRNKDGSLREAFVDEFRDAVRVERPYSKKLRRLIARQKKQALERGEEWKPHPSLLISD
jgi:hypothetical protein